MLLDERPLVLLPSLANAVGVNEAVVVQQLHFHLANSDNGRVHDGARWIFKTYEDWRKDDFPFWSVRVIQRTFRGLEKRGFILSCQPEGRESRRKYYRIDYARLKKFHARTRGTYQNRRIEGTKNGASSYTETTRTKTTLNTANARNNCSTRNVKSKPQQPASPGLVLKGEKNSEWLKRAPLHVLKRRRDEYRNERSQLLKEYGNGAFSDSERLASFRENAPREAQGRYNWLRPKIDEIDETITDRSKP